jgi:hypothetical protein
LAIERDIALPCHITYLYQSESREKLIAVVIWQFPPHELATAEGCRWQVSRPTFGPEPLQSDSLNFCMHDDQADR